jgi:predicted site-specific integrase-resolvase
MFDRRAVCNLTVHHDASIEQHQECPESQACKKKERIEAIYARVSTRKQLEYLETQIQGLQATYSSAIVYRDFSSGLNFKLSLSQRVLEGCVQVLHVTYRDRLCRFAYDLIERIFKYHGTTITVEAYNALSPEHELAEDVLSIITVFSARMYGRRSGCARARGGGGK